MSANCFFDTNILLYAYDRDAGAKRDTAAGLVSEALKNPKSAAISVQVLNEFHVNFVKAGGSREDLLLIIDDFCRWKVVDLSLPLYKLAVALQRRYQVSHWDSMILAAAHVAKSNILYSEDFNDGQDYGSVRVVNPFV